ncbi:MAG: hypothetical protein M3150_04160 [Pseudomonadota bacterium]|nr:hypothetical protein [Pseudomonadota bacterium]
MAAAREGNLEAPTRHPVDWKNPAFHDEKVAFDELERIFDICHGYQGFDVNSLGPPRLEHPISLVRMAYGLK